jgi:hypothetical protein
VTRLFRLLGAGSTWPPLDESSLLEDAAGPNPGRRWHRALSTWDGAV